MICYSFVVGQFDGEFVNGMRIKIEVEFILAPNKYLLQAIDTKQNRFSIKTRTKFFKDDKKLIIDFNGLIGKVNYDSWKPSEGIFYLQIEFLFEENNLYYRYKYQSNYELLLSNIQIVFNNNRCGNNNKQIYSSLDWPDARDLNKINNQTKIWLGYSNKIINNYDCSKNNNNQFIIGCVYLLKVNNKETKLEMNGDNFYIYCIRKGLIESICNQYGDCENKTISRGFHYHILECNYDRRSSFSLERNTAKYCHREVSNKNIELFHSYERFRKHTKSIILISALLTQQAITQGFVEITTRNDTLIRILTSFKQIILVVKHDKSSNWSKHILYEISSNRIHILKIEFTKSNSTFKVSNGYFIKTLVLPQLESVKLIHVDQNFKNNICQQLTEFDFSYDNKQFRPRNESNVPYWIIFLIMIISVSSLILIGIVWIISKTKKQKQNIPITTLNIYKEPIVMDNFAP